MKTITKLYLGLSLVLMGLNEVAAQAAPVPEMDTSFAALGVGLAVGLAALISEHRRRK